jgi:hypothetical protein
MDIESFFGASEEKTAPFEQHCTDFLHGRRNSFTKSRFQIKSIGFAKIEALTVVYTR